MPATPPPAFMPPGIGIWAPPRPPRPPPPDRPPPSETRLVSILAFGLKRMRCGPFVVPCWVPCFTNPVMRAEVVLRRRLTTLMITAQHLEVRAGARLLMEHVNFRVAAGDKVGLVGRNGAGKTTLTKILAGEAQPASGKVLSTGEVGYLPQDPRIGDPEMLARDRILSARGLDDVVRRLRESETEMGLHRSRYRERGMKRYAAGGRRAARRGRVRRRVGGSADRRRSLGIEDAHPQPAARDPQWRSAPTGRARPDPVLGSGDAAARRAHQPPRRRLDRVAARVPQGHKGGLIVISHDNALLEATVNKVLHLDANRGEIDVYNMGWKAYLAQRETDERRRKRERANAERKAKTLTDQANKMRAKASKATAAQSMLKRAEKMMAGLEGERAADKVARIKFPAPAPCGKTPITAERAVEVLRFAGGVHRRRPGDRQGQPGRHPRSQRCRQDHDAADPGGGRRSRTPARW